MTGALILILLLFIASLPILRAMANRFRWFSLQLMKNLYWYHMFFAGVYYVFALYAPSDSVAYYQRSGNSYNDWLSIYATGTPFIDFIAYPFVNYLGFTYEMMMVLFAWLGYWGFVYFYIFFRENLRHKHFLLGIDFLTLIMFLPNMHYWTASLGKGSVVFWGLGLAVYGISRLNSRKIVLIIALLVIYHVRPHVFLILCAGIFVGLFTGRQRVPLYQKLFVIAGIGVAMALLYKEIFNFASLDSENLFNSFDQLASHRAAELAKSGSGIDISGYPLIMKLFTFWFRPLFFDAPGPIGIIVSFENMLYLFLAAQLFQIRFVSFISSSSALVKTSAIVFLGISFALSGTLSNLGIIIRQKSMVMYFFVFIILSLMDYKKTRMATEKMRALAGNRQPAQLT